MLFICTIVILAFAALPDEKVHHEQKMEETTPLYLYKVLSDADWKRSQGSPSIKLPAADEAFIHFSKEDQLDRLLTKYWADEAEYVILKIDTSKLKGNMAFESNPGSSSKYYHLYNGSIPMDAIVETKIVCQVLN